MFGMQGCSTEPTYHFGLPLDKWAPDWFKQTGDCGYDAPVVPDGTQLGDFQRWLIEVYQASDGWYLFRWKFMDMAESLHARLRLPRGASPGSSRRLGHARHEEGLILHSVFTRPLRAKPGAVPVQPPTGCTGVSGPRLPSSQAMGARRHQPSGAR